MITLLPFKLPPPSISTVLQLPGKLLPGQLHSGGLTLVLNRLLAEPLAKGYLGFLQDQILQIEVIDLALDYRLTLQKDKLIAASSQTIPSVRFGGNAKEFLLLALNKEDPDTLFFQRRLQLEGDTELGLEIKNLLYSLDDNLLPDPVHKLASRIAGLSW